MFEQLLRDMHRLLDFPPKRTAQEIGRKAEEERGGTRRIADEEEQKKALFSDMRGAKLASFKLLIVAVAFLMAAHGLNKGTAWAPAVSWLAPVGGIIFLFVLR